jgi:hypothetical protein
MLKATIEQSIFSDLADFIVSRPTLESIIDYRLPETLDQRIHDLLEKNREHGLTSAEREEMDKFLAMSHLMTLAKAKARLKMADKA